MVAEDLPFGADSISAQDAVSGLPDHISMSCAYPRIATIKRPRVFSAGFQKLPADEELKSVSDGNTVYTGLLDVWERASRPFRSRLKGAYSGIETLGTFSVPTLTPGQRWLLAGGLLLLGSGAVLTVAAQFEETSGRTDSITSMRGPVVAIALLSPPLVSSNSSPPPSPLLRPPQQPGFAKPAVASPPPSLPMACSRLPSMVNLRGNGQRTFCSSQQGRGSCESSYITSCIAEPCPILLASNLLVSQCSYDRVHRRCVAGTFISCGARLVRQTAPTNVGSPVGQSEAVVEELNKRFEDGQPSDNLYKTGVVLTSFSSSNHATRPWLPCLPGSGGCNSELADRFSASVVNVGSPIPYDQGNDANVLTCGGLVLSPAMVPLLCSYYASGRSRSKRCNGGPVGGGDPGFPLSPIVETGGRGCLPGCGPTWCPRALHPAWHCAWRPQEVASMMRQQEEMGSESNELVLSTDSWESLLPQLIQAFFVLRDCGEPAMVAMRQVHSLFLTDHPASGAPLLTFESFSDAPFKLLEKD